MPTTASAAAPVEIPPKLLAEWLGQPDVTLIDVREYFEHVSESIASARHRPLGSIIPEALQVRPGQRLIFYCRSGKRASEAAARCCGAGQPAFILAGGIEGWKAAGLPVERHAAAPRFDVMRQTQVTIGAIVLLGVAAGAFWSAWFLLLSAFMGAGLVLAGLSGTCGLALLLGRMPWNRTTSCGVHKTLQ